MSACDQSALEALAARVGKLLLANGECLATAESCTGGWVAQCVTAIAGSSEWFDCGFVSYSNEAKTEILGVAAETLAAHGAVSEASAAAMALGRGVAAVLPGLWRSPVSPVRAVGLRADPWAPSASPGPGRRGNSTPTPVASPATARRYVHNRWRTPSRGCCSAPAGAWPERAPPAPSLDDRHLSSVAVNDEKGACACVAAAATCPFCWNCI